MIAPLGERRFILGTFEPHLPLAQDGLIARFQFLQRGQGEFQFGRLQCLQHFLRDGAIQQITTEDSCSPWSPEPSRRNRLHR